MTKRMMLMGESLVGKSTLIRLLSGEEYTPRRAMAVEFFGQFINTPGEFLENRRFYHALITSSADCDVLVIVQDATRKSSLFPPLFAAMFNRKVVGVISKIDTPDADPKCAELFLRNAGVVDIIQTSCVTGEGLDALRAMIE